MNAPVNIKKCRVRCYKVKEGYHAYIYCETDTNWRTGKHWVQGKTREGTLKKLILQVFDDLVFEEDNNLELIKRD